MLHRYNNNFTNADNTDSVEAFQKKVNLSVTAFFFGGLTHFCPPFQHLLSERLRQQMFERWAKIGCKNATVGKNGLISL